jgi:hypothetical protein
MARSFVPTISRNLRFFPRRRRVKRREWIANLPNIMPHAVENKKTKAKGRVTIPIWNILAETMRNAEAATVALLISIISARRLVILFEM